MEGGHVNLLCLFLFIFLKELSTHGIMIGERAKSRNFGVLFLR